MASSLPEDFDPSAPRSGVRCPHRPTMEEDDPNLICVASWIERTAPGLSGEEHVQLFEMSLAAMWTRSQRPLGDVTVAAIMDRVVCTAVERFPVLAGLHVEASGVSCLDLRARARAAEADNAQLLEAIRFVLVEYLTVLGNLTADIFTPALRAELSAVAIGTARAASVVGKRKPWKRKR